MKWRTIDGAPKELIRAAKLFKPPQLGEYRTRIVRCIVEENGVSQFREYVVLFGFSGTRATYYIPEKLPPLPE